MDDRIFNYNEVELIIFTQSKISKLSTNKLIDTICCQPKYRIIEFKKCYISLDDFFYIMSQLWIKMFDLRRIQFDFVRRAPPFSNTLLLDVRLYYMKLYLNSTKVNVILSLLSVHDIQRFRKKSIISKLPRPFIRWIFFFI